MLMAPKRLKGTGGLQREHAAGEEPRQDDNGQRAHADRIHLGEDVVPVMAGQ